MNLISLANIYHNLILYENYVITSNFHRDEIRVPKQLKKGLVDHRSLLHRLTLIANNLDAVTCFWTT